MAEIQVDATGLRCPQPILKLTVAARDASAGDLIVIRADCPTFEGDVRKWCSKMNKVLIALTLDGDVKTAQVQF
jgi:tRNA 2-thiouridine synthesizing protein A